MKWKRAAVVILMLLPVSALVACERRGSEPVAPSSSTAAPPLVTITAAAPSTTSGVAGRCVRPTAAAPVRPRPAPGPDPACPTDPGAPSPLRHARVLFDQAGAMTEVEVADEQPARMRGLMYRRSLGEDQGMLFVFPRRRVQRFWMKNTCLPLDMLFIDRDGLIVGIEENIPTLNERTYQAGCPSSFVLEVNAGWSRRHGVGPGQRARFEGL